MIAPPPSSPDLPTVLIDHAVGRDRRRGAAPVELDRRAANVENRVALERLQRSGIGEPHASVAGIDDARRSVDREEAVALHGDVEWIARRDQGPRTARDEPGSGRDVAAAVVARLGDLRLERDAVRAVTRRIHIGDIRRDRFQPPLESNLRRQRHVESVLHEHASNRASRFPTRAPRFMPLRLVRN